MPCSQHHLPARCRGRHRQVRQIAGGLMPRRMPGAQRPQHFIARDRVDPDARVLHLPQHLRRRARLHRKARLHAVGESRDELDVGDPLADDAGIVEPEGRADFLGERTEQGGRWFMAKGADDARRPARQAPFTSHSLHRPTSSSPAQRSRLQRKQRRQWQRKPLHISHRDASERLRCLEKNRPLSTSRKANPAARLQPRVWSDMRPAKRRVRWKKPCKKLPAVSPYPYPDLNGDNTFRKRVLYPVEL